MENLSLTIFSVFIQAAIGMMALVAIGMLVNKDGIYKKPIIVAAVLAVVGLGAAFFHLGNPFAAFNALSGFRHSWLSREIWLVMTFIGLVFFVGGLTLFKPKAKGAITALSITAGVIGLVAIYGMGSIYATTSVPFWQHYTTYVGFYVSALAIGAAVFLALSSKEAGKYGKIIALCVPLVLIVCAAVTMTYYVQMGAQTNMAIQETLSILSSLRTAIIVQWLFALTGAGLLFFFATKEQKTSAGIYAATAMIIVGLFIGRYIFYAAEAVTKIGLY